MKKLICLLFISIPFLSFSQLDKASIERKLNEIFANECVQQMLSIEVLPRNLMSSLVLDKVTVYYHETYDKPTYLVPAVQNNRLIGALDISKIDTSKSKLANNCQYAIVWRDYSSTVISDLTGKYSGEIKCYDLNKSGYDFAKFFMLENEVSSYEFKQEVAGRENPGAVFCDRNYGNGNGNLGYGECMRCILNTCYGNSQCTLLLTFSNVLGNLIGQPNVGHAHLSTGCFILSIMY